MTPIIGKTPVVEFYEKLVPARHVMTADHLISLKHKNQLDVWVVIDAVIDTWRKKKPDEWNSFLMDVGRTKETRANKFGESKKEKLRYLVDCPEWVCKAIRFLYDPEELPMNKEFWRAFWKRYPNFRVSERS